jgi:hypothetical protein
MMLHETHKYNPDVAPPIPRFKSKTGMMLHETEDNLGLNMMLNKFQIQNWNDAT